MPAKSIKQQEMMAIAEHNPEELSEKNKGVLKMSHKQLHDFAATSHKGLPQHVTGESLKRHAKKKYGSH